MKSNTKKRNDETITVAIMAKSKEGREREREEEEEEGYKDSSHEWIRGVNNIIQSRLNTQLRSSRNFL
jgi:hypothetical protein